jgi:hypothetical protein
MLLSGLYRVAYKYISMCKWTKIHMSDWTCANKPEGFNGTQLLYMTLSQFNPLPIITIFCLRSISVLECCLLLGLSSDRFLNDFLTKILCARLVSPCMLNTMLYATNLNPSDFTTWTVSDDLHNSRISSSYRNIICLRNRLLISTLCFHAFVFNDYSSKTLHFIARHNW